jgi:hypothetical protein
MKKLPARQKGGSIIVTIITLAVIGLAAFVGFQYIPQIIESRSIDSILDTMTTRQHTDPVTDAGGAREELIKLLQINEMNDMMDSFTVSDRDARITIVFSYDRELNLIYKVHPMHYEKTVSL